MKQIIAAAGLLLFLGGCGISSYGDFARVFIGTKSAKMADTTLSNSIWGVCQATSMGAVMRRFGRSRTAMDAYVALCYPKPNAPIIPISPPGPAPAAVIPTP